jgi:hypothetical protein
LASYQRGFNSFLGKPFSSIPKVGYMARIFSINFDYEGMVHTAMVSVRNTPFFTEYNISMLSEDLMQQLPIHKIVSTTPNQLTFMNTPVKDHSVLMDSILTAVAHHVQTSTV